MKTTREVESLPIKVEDVSTPGDTTILQLSTTEPIKIFIRNKPKLDKSTKKGENRKENIKRYWKIKTK